MCFFFYATFYLKGCFMWLLQQWKCYLYLITMSYLLPCGGFSHPSLKLRSRLWRWMRWMLVSAYRMESDLLFHLSSARLPYLALALIGLWIGFHCVLIMFVLLFLSLQPHLTSHTRSPLYGPRFTGFSICASSAFLWKADILVDCASCNTHFRVCNKGSIVLNLVFCRLCIFFSWFKLIENISLELVSPYCSLYNTVQLSMRHVAV